MFVCMCLCQEEIVADGPHNRYRNMMQGSNVGDGS